MTLAEKQRQLHDDLAAIDNAQERFSVAIDRSRSRPALPAADRVESNRVKGCISSVWIVSELRDGRCHFRSDADSPLVKGLIALLCELYDDGTPAEVAALEPALFDELGLNRNLSPTRRNGLASARAFIRDFALGVHPAHP